MSRHETAEGGTSDPEHAFYRLNADGGIVAAQGQSEGEAAIGAVLRKPDGSVLHQISARIGWVADHHVAEYQALIEGLQFARSRGISHIQVLLDSAVVVNQVNGEWNVAKDHLKPLCTEAQALARGFVDIVISHVDRRENSEAHALADEALTAIR